MFSLSTNVNFTGIICLFTSVLFLNISSLFDYGTFEQPFFPTVHRILSTNMIAHDVHFQEFFSDT